FGTPELGPKKRATTRRPASNNQNSWYNFATFSLFLLRTLFSNVSYSIKKPSGLTELTIASSRSKSTNSSY
ncbi:12736_t:CDS:1, partial [Dentiscutata heterogama]